MLQGRWKVSWSNAPNFGRQVQTFSGFKKYPPKTVRVRNVYQQFDVEQHIIVQSAELDIIGEESSAAHVMFDLIGKFEFMSEKDFVTDFTSMQLTGTIMPRDWVPFADTPTAIVLPRACFKHITLQSHTRVVSGGRSPYFTLFHKEY